VSKESHKLRALAQAMLDGDDEAEPEDRQQRPPPLTSAVHDEIHRLARSHYQGFLSWRDAAVAVDVLIPGPEGCPQRRIAMSILRRISERLARGE
jgi:hypothetical protein